MRLKFLVLVHCALKCQAAFVGGFVVFNRQRQWDTQHNNKAVPVRPTSPSWRAVRGGSCFPARSRTSLYAIRGRGSSCGLGSDNDATNHSSISLKVAGTLPQNRVQRTVVILYNKPPNVITSHSNADAAPMSYEKTLGGESDDRHRPGGRMTVYEDVMSMRGYVPHINDGGDHLESPASTSAGGVPHSFEGVTGITTKLHAVGRLDADTTGLLLLTNDGGLVHHATNPVARRSRSNNDDEKQKNATSLLITKTYEALIMGHHDETSPAIRQILSEGVDIGAKYGGLTKPAQSVEILSHPTAKSTLVSITIAEGKNRQVRRMFHGVHSGVMKLRRTQMGGVIMGDLKEGQWRVMSDDEVWEALHWRARELDRAEIRSKTFGKKRAGAGAKVLASEIQEHHRRTKRLRRKRMKH